MLQARKSNGLKPLYYRDDLFQFSTRIHYKEFWRALVSIEKSSEFLRIRLARDSQFDALEAFKYLDMNKDGVVTEKELQKALRYKRFEPTELELK